MIQGNFVIGNFKISLGGMPLDPPRCFRAFVARNVHPIMKQLATPLTDYGEIISENNVWLTFDIYPPKCHTDTVVFRFKLVR